MFAQASLGYSFTLFLSHRHLMAEHALSQWNLKVAEHSFVRCKDYAGIQLVKRLSNLQVRTKHMWLMVPSI